MQSKYLFLSFIFFFSTFIFLSAVFFSPLLLAKEYRPEISGSFESGDRLYTDPGEIDEHEPNDYYRYDKQWLKYRQKLAVGEYYYLKVLRQEKIYDQSENYNSLNLETEGNYTFHLTEKLRNRFKLLLRDKDYLIDQYNDKDYQLARLQYTLQYKKNKIHDYQLILQRQWTSYQENSSNDYTKDRIAVKWGWKMTENLALDTKLQYDWQRNDHKSKRTDKDGRKISLKFKYKL